MNNLKSYTGKILLAEPFMMDPNFKRTVTLICEHTKEGSIGFVLNRRLQVSIDELIEEFPDFHSPVFYGGPVQEDTVHYLHNVGDLLEDSQKITTGLYWGGNFEKLKFLISAKLVKPENIRFFVGYSGWSPQQLEEEQKSGSWIVTDMHANYLFKSNPDQLWQQIMALKGKAFSVIAQMPDSISWN